MVTIMLSKIILLLALFATSSLVQAQESEWLKLEPVSLTSLYNGQITKFEHDGRLTLVYFFASWCDTCYSHTQILKYLEQKYAKLGLRVVLIYLHEPYAEAKRHLEKMGFGREAFLGNDEIITNFRNPIAPAIFLIDRKGYLTGRFTEAAQLNDLSQLITLSMSI